MKLKDFLRFQVVGAVLMALLVGCGATPTPAALTPTVAAVVQPTAAPTQAAAQPTTATAPTPPAATQAPQASAAQELTILVPVDFTSFDPNTVRSQVTENIAQQVIEFLVTRDGKPLLADSWKLVNDTTWQFSLHKGVKFTDGETFDAKTVKLSIERILRKDNQNTSALGLFGDAIASVEAVDDNTVNVVTKKPFPSLLDLMALAPMLPPNVADSKDFSANGIGSGPYMLI